MGISWRWLAIRIAALPLVFLAVSFASYFLIYGPFARDPEAICFRVRDVTREQCDRIPHELGYDRPLVHRYVSWLGDAVRGDLGNLQINGESVTHTIGDRLPATIELFVISLAIAALLGTALAYGASQRRIAGRASSLVSSILGSMPLFVTATLVIVYPSVGWAYSQPVGGYKSLIDNPSDNLRLLLPAGALIGLATSGSFARWIVLGDPQSRSRWPSSALRALAHWIPLAATGILIVERINAIEGIGSLFFQAVFVGDLAVAHVLLSLATFIGVALWLFIVDRDGIEAAERQSPIKIRTLARDPLVVAAIAIIIVFLFAALAGPYLTPHDARGGDVSSRFVGASGDHWLGTNRLGQDVFSRVLVGGRNTLNVSALAVIGGLLPGMIAGFAVTRLIGRWRESTTHVASLFLGAPMLWWVLAASLAVFTSERSAMITVAVLLAPVGFLSVARAVALLRLPDSPRESLRILAAPLAAAVFEGFAVAILLHATFHFFVPFYPATWGGDINQALGDLPDYPHVFWPPAAALFFVLLALSVLADALRSDLRDQSADADVAVSCDVTG